MDIPIGFAPMKKCFADTPITSLARDDGGYRGIRTLPSGATNLHAQKPIHYIPHDISERWDLNP